MIGGQFGGTSLLGEIWYAEADTPVGPWVYAKKIVTHSRYTFYNPTQHPFFDQGGGRRIYFEGTYTNSFTDNQDPTPRYDYNQILYRLALDDPRLALPAPVYHLSGSDGVPRYCLKEGMEAMDKGAEEAEAANRWQQATAIPFFAVPGNRCGKGLIPIFASQDTLGSRLQLSAPRHRTKPAVPLFFALPADNDGPYKLAPQTALLYEYRNVRTGVRAYDVDSSDDGAKHNAGHLARARFPLCRVWRNPMTNLILDFQTRPIP